VHRARYGGRGTQREARWWLGGKTARRDGALRRQWWCGGLQWEAVTPTTIGGGVEGEASFNQRR
jgi:hypothetical protein